MVLGQGLYLARSQGLVKPGYFLLVQLADLDHTLGLEDMADCLDQLVSLGQNYHLGYMARLFLESKVVLDLLDHTLGLEYMEHD